MSGRRSLFARAGAHQIIELDEPRVVFHGRVLGAALRMKVVVKLAARAARAGGPCCPEVVFVAEPLNALHRHTYLVAPDGKRLRVVLVDADPHALGRQAKLDSGELPRPPAQSEVSPGATAISGALRT